MRYLFFFSFINVSFAVNFPSSEILFVASSFFTHSSFTNPFLRAILFYHSCFLPCHSTLLYSPLPSSFFHHSSILPHSTSSFYFITLPHIFILLHSIFSFPLYLYHHSSILLHIIPFSLCNSSIILAFYFIFSLFSFITSIILPLHFILVSPFLHTSSLSLSCFTSFRLLFPCHSSIVFRFILIHLHPFLRLSVYRTLASLFQYFSLPSLCSGPRRQVCEMSVFPS